jgi:hypothetical protein
MRRIWEPCSFVGQQGVCTVCFPTFYIFMYPHLQIAVSVDAHRKRQPWQTPDRVASGRNAGKWRSRNETWLDYADRYVHDHFFPF